MQGARGLRMIATGSRHDKSAPWEIRPPAYLFDTIKPPCDSDHYIGDTLLAGFRLRVTVGGGRILNYGYRAPDGRQRKITKGKSVDEARRLAMEAAAAVLRGDDPQEEKDRRAMTPTLAEAFALFDAEHLAPHTKASTRAENLRLLGTRFPKSSRRHASAMLGAGISRNWHESRSGQRPHRGPSQLLFMGRRPCRRVGARHQSGVKAQICPKVADVRGDSDLRQVSQVCQVTALRSPCWASDF
jgi:hypothetical protein